MNDSTEYYDLLVSDSDEEDENTYEVDGNKLLVMVSHKTLSTLNLYLQIKLFDLMMKMQDKYGEDKITDDDICNFTQISYNKFKCKAKTASGAQCSREMKCDHLCGLHLKRGARHGYVCDIAEKEKPNQKSKQNKQSKKKPHFKSHTISNIHHKKKQEDIQELEELSIIEQVLQGI
jgi:hypothetical protein